VRNAWIGFLLLAVGCSSVTSQYRRAKEEDSVEAYSTFLQRHPGSEFEAVASRRLDDLLFKEAKGQGTSSALACYLDVSVLSYHRHEADSLLERALLVERSKALEESLTSRGRSELLLELGETLLALAEGHEAALCFARAESLGVSPFECRLGLGRSYSLLGEDTRAMGEFQKALSMNPNSVKAYLHLGRHHWRRDQHERALGAYLEALERSPKDMNLRFELGVLYLHAPNPAEAVRELKAVTGSDSEHADALYWLGIAYAEMGDSDLAVLWLRRYLQEMRKEGDQAEVERTEAKIHQIKPLAGTAQAKVIPGQTYKNQEKNKQKRSDRGDWARFPRGVGRHRGRRTPWSY
jgi:tetratricopeptide (TPR) repeat protein